MLNNIPLDEIEICENGNFDLPKYEVWAENKVIAYLPTIKHAKDFIRGELDHPVAFHLAMELDLNGNRFWTLEKP